MGILLKTKVTLGGESLFVREDAVSGTALYVCNDDDDELEEIKEDVEEEYNSVVKNFGDRQDYGVYVMASTLGSLEALLGFLKEENIPVFDVNIGVVHKMDVKKAALMQQKGKPEFSVILCFDVKVDADAKKEAAKQKVQIFTADIIYHLEDQFKKYMKEVQERKKNEVSAQAVFPCVLKPLDRMVFMNKNPIVYPIYYNYIQL